MKIQLSKNGRKWSLYGALLTAMAYSALTLTSQPAYAAMCNNNNCPNYAALCYGECTQHGHGRPTQFACPVLGNPYEFYCKCTDGFQFYGGC
jgi:hypothetical protein